MAFYAVCDRCNRQGQVPYDEAAGLTRAAREKQQKSILNAQFTHYECGGRFSIVAGQPIEALVPIALGDFDAGEIELPKLPPLPPAFPTPGQPRIEASRDRAQSKVDMTANSIEATHRVFVERLGKKYEGVRDTSTIRTSRDGARGFHRTARCYNCKYELDNEVQLECRACGWIICVCGACGCGYCAS